MRWPTFLVLGAAKAGTTSLYHYIKQHPQIYMSRVKEPNFFAFGEAPLPNFVGPGAHQLEGRAVTTLEAYLALFADVRDELAWGEMSITNILPRACERIKYYIPKARLIVILRQPAERAYSQFLHARRIDWEPLVDFRAALAAEEMRSRQNWQLIFLYTRPSYYYENLRRFFTTFGADQIRVYLYEDWQAQPAATLQDFFRFIGVDDGFVPDMTERHNTGILPYSPQLNRWMSQPSGFKNAFRYLLPPTARRTLFHYLRKLNRKKPPPLDPTVRAWLTERYRDDILQLQDLIGRDLSHWLC